MKMKKILALAVVCFFAMYSISFAAIGGSKARVSTPKPPAATQKAPTQKVQDTKKDGYQPSQSAKDIKDKAPEAGSKTNAAAATTKPQSSSMLGGMMSKIGMFAGGMMLGSLLGSMFGMGSGMFADILGLAMNLLIIGGIFMVGKMLWNKFTSKKKDEENIYKMNERR